MTIIAKNLCKTFDNGKTFALDNVSIQIDSGEFIAIIGLSGAGKSTFLRTINATCPPSSGELQVLDFNINEIKGGKLVQLRKQIGFIFQQFNLIKNLSVIQNVLMGRIAYISLWRALTGLFPLSDKLLAKKILDSVGLEGRYYDKARTLSGGQQQRVAIARTLVQQPKIILADEPMASLDPRLAEHVISMLTKINKEQKITILVNIHSLELAKKYAHRLLGFRKGQLIFDGAPENLSQEKINAIYAIEQHTME